MFKLENITYGAISAVMTGLAIIIGLSSTINAKTNIVVALLIIAIADNISDSFGIHFQEESQLLPKEKVRDTTLLNFVSRFVTTAVIIIFVIIFTINLAIITSIIFCFFVIIYLSYLISKRQKINPTKAIMRHLAIAIALMIASYILREIISKYTVKAF